MIIGHVRKNRDWRKRRRGYKRERKCETTGGGGDAMGNGKTLWEGCMGI
jgi:hypothetical protein